jgi:hypothetical protein
MQTEFQKDWIKEQDTNTIAGYAKATMLREKYELMNTETLWLDEHNDSMVSFQGNSYSADIVEKNKKGLQKVAHKIFQRFQNIERVFFMHILFERG